MMALLISSYRPNVKGEAIASDSVSDSKWGKIVSETLVLENDVRDVG
jgi:hypothetical protein